MADIDYEMYNEYINTEVAALREQQDDAMFWKQLDEDLAIYDKK